MPLSPTQNFTYFLGKFHGCWSSIELSIDCAIGRFLKLSPRDSLVITAGMEFNAKAKILHDVVYRSDDPKKSEILGLLGEIRNNAKRVPITHSFMMGEKNKITFFERPRGQKFVVKEHVFTDQGWVEHVSNFIINAQKLDSALGLTPDVIQEFLESALRDS